MGSKTRVALSVVVGLGLAVAVQGQTLSSQRISSGSRVFIAAMPDGFDQYLKAAFEKKAVPLTIVHDRADAEFEITGHSETHKPGIAQKLILGRWRTDEQASIQVVHLGSGEVAFAYSANKQNSAYGKRSTAEACAKHLKKRITSGR